MTDNDDSDNRNFTTYNDVQIVSNNNANNDLNKSLMNVKVYKKRWLMLVLFASSSLINMLPFTQYSIIANIVVRYYGVSTVAVDWTVMIYLLLYLPLVIPATSFFEKIGLRKSLILSISVTTLGSWIKVFSISPDRFYVAFIGQTVIAATMITFLSSPSRVSAQWFPSDQVSTASSLGLLGTYLGSALGFLIPPIIVKNHDDLNKVGENLQVLNYLYAGLSTIIAACIILFFKEEPKLPPSAARVLLKINRIENKEGFMEPLKRLSKNKCFILLCNAHGLNVGTLNAVETLLNQIYLIHFPNGEEDAGRIGLLLVIFGMAGAVSFGIILDKTRKFKATSVTVYFLSLLGQIIFALSISIKINWIVYASIIFLGFFMTGYYSLAYELCAEYTYPESEFITAGILIVASNVYGIALITILSELMKSYGDIAAHIGFCSALLIGFIISISIKDDLRRENARKAAVYQNVSTKDDLILDQKA